MRFQTFGDRAPLEVQAVQFPWNSAVTFHIHRAGRREFAERARSQARQKMPAVLEAAARKKGLTLGDLQSGEVDVQAMLGELELTDIGVEFLLDTELDFEGVAAWLVEKVDGPLILADDSDDVLGWHDEEDGLLLGEQFLRQAPDEITAWIVDEAQRVEAEFQAFVGAAAGNLSVSSEPSEATEADAS